VKRWPTIVLTFVLALGIGYVVLQRPDPGFTGAQAAGTEESRTVSEPVIPAARPAAIAWEKIDRHSDGFNVEMPADIRHIQIPAYNETGGTEPVDFIFSNPDAETTFSVAWADNPPVARVSNRLPDRALEMARNGAVARTQTTLVSESAINMQGYPGRDFAARNTGGGVMNSRLIYAGSRLYMLSATFPSASARRDRDVERFFSSFTILSSGMGKSGPQSPSNGE
jgi:hypothetical protein